jgi:hypothetical protein
MPYLVPQIDNVTNRHQPLESVSWHWRHKSSSPTSLRMRINTRELEQTLPVGVHVQIKALGLQGCVPFPH